MNELYLDESGHTGEDLVNREQPVYALAAVSLSADVARDIAARCFPKAKAPELHHATLVKTPRGRSQILDLIAALEDHPGSASLSVVHKECSLVGRFVDHWVETAFRLMGKDLYERGGNIGLMNLMFMTLGATLGEEGRREFLRGLQVMFRDRSKYAYRTFWDTLDDLMTRFPQFADLFGLFRGADAMLGFDHLLNLPEQSLDTGDIALLDTVDHWRRRTEGRLLLFHDHSKTLVRNRELWERLLSEDAPARIVGYDRRTTQFPLNAELRLVDSADFASLQLADVVASAGVALISTKAGRTPKYPDYVEKLQKSSLLDQCLIGGVWPMPWVLPKDLETEGPVLEDPVEFMADLMRKR